MKKWTLVIVIIIILASFVSVKLLRAPQAVEQETDRKVQDTTQKDSTRFIPRN